MEVQIPYGQQEISVTVPEKNLLGVFHPNPVRKNSQQSTLLEALKHPLESLSFEEFLDDARDVLFIVNDGTRPTPTSKVLELLRDQITAVNAEFIVATGIHRPPTEEELRFIFGPLLSEFRDRIHIHSSRNEQEMISLGTSKNGTEMLVNRLGVRAHKLVPIGSVEPHYFGGYTGGRKSFLPGIASHRTIEQNHRHAIRPEAKTLNLSGNPVHEDMIDAIGTIQDKEVFSIQVVLDRERRIYAATAGDIHASFDAAIAKANEVFCVSIPEKADIVVSAVPYPMDVDLYQSQKAIDNGKLALKQQGVLILVSQCRTGVGERTFLDLLAGAKTPQDALHAIDRGYVLGYHKAAKMAEVALWAKMWAVTDLSDTDVESVFMRSFPSVQRAIDAAIDRIGKDAKLLFLTDGSVTVPMIQ